ncbi:MAG: tRNA pseudouridine(55) synthase TruB [Chloroflexota bacterium]|mgnify:CR=1 FL=1
MASQPFGFLNIDKPVGMTSHDVVGHARRVFRMKKIGHAGTLDPLASGVLVLCVGGATRLSDYVMHSTKRYRAHVRLGAVTDTYDAEGEVTPVADPGGITTEAIERALDAFRGEIDQLPPMYSAIKQGGRKLYELARAGQTVERQPRRVTIHALDLCEWTPPDLTLDVTCSAGTYIRSLAHDLGQSLGVGGYLTALVRTASGSFRLEDSISLSALSEAGEPEQFLIPPRQALADWPSLELTDEAVDRVRHGRAISGVAADGTIAFAYGPNGGLVAVLRAEGGMWKPQKVFL